MKNVIVGTAGHVDHGKTCLIKALTGTDTDRLKEEKKRGITIENGFADMQVGELNVSIIDVPGHERFVRNMLAGIGGIDLVLLIVGLDEGVMPQTVEHFRILEMLKIRRGIVVYTKSDLATDEEWKELVKDDVRELLKGSFMEGAPEIEVSAFSGQNVEELKKLIAENVDYGALKDDGGELFRLPVDRVFTMDGFGTVVTGTLIEGSIGAGDELMIYPEGITAKARNVQVHGESVKRACAGQRTAINLQGIKKQEIRRGSVLAKKGALSPEMIFDAKLSIFPDCEKSVRNGSRVHFFCGSSETLAKVVLLDRDELSAGESCYAQLRLEEAFAFKNGDRFIVRFYSPMITLGGGKLLECGAKKHKRFDEKALNALRIKDSGSAKERCELLLSESGARALGRDGVAAGLGCTAEDAEQLLGELASEGKAVEPNNGLFVHSDFIASAARFADSLLKEYHAANPLSAGLGREEFNSKLAARFGLGGRKQADGICELLLKGGAIKERGGALSLKAFEPKYSEKALAMRGRILERYRAAAYEMPTVDEITAEEKGSAEARHILEALENEGELVRLNSQYYIYGEAYEHALSELRKKAEAQGNISLAEFRDILGTSRKFAMAILEYTDGAGITLKVGDVRQLA